MRFKGVDVMYQLIQIKEHGDERGKLFALENRKEIPFDIKRIFFISDVREGESRGNHANMESQFVLICVTGKCKIEIDMGEEKEIVVLDRADKALYLSPNVWKRMYDFSEGAVLLVLSDTEYCVDDYIYDYEEYLRGLL